jgi:hypothetical protein
MRDSALVAALHNLTRAKYRNALQVLKGKKTEIAQPQALERAGKKPAAAKTNISSLAA